MYLRPGYSYVYQRFKDGHCFNISTDCEGNPAALLIRAIEPYAKKDENDKNIERLLENRMKNRQKQVRTHLIGSGPGNLCSAMNITLDHDGIDITLPDSVSILTNHNLFILDRLYT
eukprot:TRINITY_DN6038_c0_g1_i1.p1 TRINITY_DN6038_c0_g1~~TRINITY_DN6038_c0_g1_i1.p1  ORF type:complete len:116 (-),score=2.69 TRINITY_DN6038_c0_g1_i1:303-650(-)